MREVVRPDPVRLLETETISQALLRLRGGTLGERIVYFYVTDQTGRLVGVVPTRRLLLSDPSRFVGEVMVHPVFSVVESEPFGRALAVLAEKRLLALPVVDELGRLTGVVDVSTFTQTLFDLERREAADEVFQMVGVRIEQERSKSLAWVLARRFPWLTINIFSGLLAAVVSHVFGSVLQAIVAVAFFIPLVLTLAESVAMQTVTMSLHGLHLAGRRDGGILRECRVGLLLGVISGAIVGLLAIAWLRTIDLAAVVAGAVLLASAVGAALGYLIPRLVHRWRLDPKIASGPAVLALTDVAALSCYLGIAALVLT